MLPHTRIPAVLVNLLFYPKGARATDGYDVTMRIQGCSAAVEMTFNSTLWGLDFSTLMTVPCSSAAFKKSGSRYSSPSKLSQAQSVYAPGRSLRIEKRPF